MRPRRKLASDPCISSRLTSRPTNRKNTAISASFIHNSMFLLISSEPTRSWTGVSRKSWYHPLVAPLLAIIIARIAAMIRIMPPEASLLKNRCRCFTFYFSFRWIDRFYYFTPHESSLKPDYSVGIIRFLRAIEEFSPSAVRCVFDGCKRSRVTLSLDNHSLRWGFLRD